MCRMLAAVWRSPTGAGVAARLVGLLARSAMDDPLLAAITGGDGRHCHGYGYLLLCRHRGWLVSWERFDAADTLGVGEESCKANLEALGEAVGRLSKTVEACGEGLLVLHARRASRGEPRGSLYAHPYIHTVAGRGGQRIYALAHNGGVEKEPLAVQLGVDPSAYTDSQLLAVWLARQLSLGLTLGEALRQAEDYTKSALDLAVAILDPQAGEAVLHLYGYVKPGLDEARQRYYEPILFRGEDVEGYMSSTVKMLAEEEGLRLSYERLEGLHTTTMKLRQR